MPSKISPILGKIKSAIFAHKIISGIVVIALIGGGYYFIKSRSTTPARYILSTIEKGALVVSVDGSGQVAASNQIDLKPKVSGDITYVGVKAGQAVKKWDLIASVDSRSAKISLENAQIALAKLVKAPTALTLLQKQNAVTEAQNTLAKSYEESWNTIASAMLDLPPITDGLSDLYSEYLGSSRIYSLSSTARDRINIGEQLYYAAKKSLTDTTKVYKTMSRESSSADIESMTAKTYDTVKALADAVKTAQTNVDYMANYFDEKSGSSVTVINSDLNSWTSDINGYINSLLADQNTIVNTKHSIEQNQQSLTDLNQGADALDIRSAELAVQDRQNTYDNYFIRAPFDGTVASLTAKVGESAGSSVGTLITTDKIAEISMNEVDVAKIKLGGKAELTFDAVPGLTIPGDVTEIDSIGTVSQGVVTYQVKVNFASGDDRVKPGMSVSASIITDSKPDVLVVPSGAIKTKGRTSYVEIFDVVPTGQAGVIGVTSSVLPRQQIVTVGLSNDTQTEITSGLKEGDKIVARTIASGTQTTPSSATKTPSLFGGGAAQRAPTSTGR